MSDDSSDDDFDVVNNNAVAAQLSFLDFIEDGDVDALSSLLALGSSEMLMEVEDQYGCNAVVTAILATQLESLRFLLGHSKSGVHMPHVDGSYPLHFAVAMGSIPKHHDFAVDAVKTLLQEGEADPVVYDDFKRSPLFVAASHGLLEVCKLLLEVGKSEGIEHGMDVLSVQDIFGNTALAAAAAQGELEVVKLLFEGHNDAIHAANLRGFTPLHIAAQHGQVDIAMYLVKQGAQISAVNVYGHTPSVCAKKRGFLELSKLLVPNAKINDATVKAAKTASLTTEGRASLKTIVMNHELCLKVNLLM
jgi:ankyrin repeat protein